MKPTLRRTAGLLLLASLCLPGMPVHAQKRGNDLPRPSSNATVGQTIGVTDVTITYGRPALKGRAVFGELEKYGAVWRTGANEATTITFSDDVRIEGQPLAAGTYGLFTIPGETEWTVIFNTVAEQWGAFQYDETKDVLRVTVRPEAGPPAELVTIAFEDVTEQSARAVIAWDKVRVPFGISVDTDALTLAKARTAVAGATDWRQPLTYAFYALQNNKYMDEALTWAERSVALQENYNTFFVKASLHAALGQYAEAVATGEKALEKAQAMERKPGNLATFESNLAGWKAKI